MLLVLDFIEYRKVRLEYRNFYRIISWLRLFHLIIFLISLYLHQQLKTIFYLDSFLDMVIIQLTLLLFILLVELFLMVLFILLLSLLIYLNFLLYLIFYFSKKADHSASYWRGEYLKIIVYLLFKL